MSSENSGDRIVSCFLTELDGIFSRPIESFDGFSDILVVGATSRPQIIDRAIIRPGRLDKHIILSLPDINARRAILQLKLAAIPHTCSQADLEDLVSNSEGLSPVDLESICREAAMFSLRENFQNAFITSDHLKLALHDFLS